MAKRIHETYGASVWFAEIMGRRWSYLTGWNEETAASFTARRIELTGRFGVVVEGWEQIPTEESEALIRSLRETITTYEER
ncbi:MAG TPA: hypothetical protein PLA74_01465 [Syntrophales bacterium]|nr:hypothetical protein [Syntrophales bacterium]HPQ43794.1 hypothetical protein [Syntrophales bacterium]